MFRIGIEEEMLLLDAKTKEPVYLSMRDCQKIFGEKLFLEKCSCQLEYRSTPCQNILALKDELSMARDFLDKAAEHVGCQLIRLALHPFFNRQTNHQFKEQFIYNSVQVHIELPKPNLRYPLINHMLFYLPLFLALSASSPFYQGQQSGLHSTRSALRGMLPRHGLAPNYSSMLSYQQNIEKLSKLDVIDYAWDIRPHHIFPTIENRKMDHPFYLKDMLALAALNQALVIKLYQELIQGKVIKKYDYLQIEENKWRAMRDGLSAIFINNQEAFSVAEFLDFILDDLSGIAKETQSVTFLAHLKTMIKRGNPAKKILDIYGKTEDIHQAFSLFI